MTSQVRLIAGPPRCGKTQQLLAAYLEQAGSAVNHHSPPAAAIARTLWIAPNYGLVNQVRESLVAATAGAILGPGIHTFASYAQSVIAGSGRRLRVVSPVQKQRILQHVIRDAVRHNQLQHFAAVAHTPGFVTEVDRTIGGLKRADTRAEAYRKWCDARPRSDLRSRELAALYVGYQDALHRGRLYDTDERFWLAREILQESKAKQPTKYDQVVVCGFNEFSSSQYDLLGLLADLSQSLLISLTVEAENAQAGGTDPFVFSQTTQTFARLREIFPKLEVVCPAVEAARPGSLRQLQQRAFREPDTQACESGEFANVEIIAAASEMGELEAVAQQIKLLLASGAARPQEIIVVHRGGESVLPGLTSVFSDYGIPCTPESGPRLDSQPLVRALSTLLRLVAEDWPFQALVEVVGNRLFRRWDDSESSLDHRLRRRVALERYLRSAQLPSGRKNLLNQLEYRLQQADGNAVMAADQRFAQLSIAMGELRQLDQLLAALPAEAPIEGWIEAIERLLLQLDVFASSNARSDEADAWRQLRRALRSVQQLDRQLGADGNLTLDEVMELLAFATSQQRLATPQDAVGRVRVLSAESARKLAVEHLFLAGLGEQAFSSVPSDTTDQQQPDGSTDASGSGDSVEPITARNDAMLLMYELISRPSESLTLSFSALDSKGQPLPPTPLLADLERSLAPRRIRVRELSMGQATEQGRQPASAGGFRRQAVIRALDADVSGLAGMISQAAWVHAGSSILSGIECVARRSQRDAFGEFEGMVTSPLAQETLGQRFGSEHLWSPSRLENYAACPFRFFGEQLLGLKPLDELTLRNDARRRGSLLHQVLATIHAQLSGEASAESETGGTADDLVQRFLAAMDDLIKASPLRGIEQSLREIERREIEAWVPDYAQQELDYREQWQHLDQPPRPAHFEVRFGPPTRGSDEQPDRASVTVPFELDLGDEHILLTGQIDRVDVGRVGDVSVFNIIDYKSGQAVRLKHEKVRSGHQLQLPLYALAAERLLLADQDALALATGYWNIQGKGFVSKSGGSLQVRELANQTLKHSTDWQALQPDILERVKSIVQGIRQGDFPVYNEDEHCTRSCELSTICRVAQVRSLEKGWPPIESPGEGSDG